MTPLRMLFTMWRKNRSSGGPAWRGTARFAGGGAERRPACASGLWGMSGMSAHSVFVERESLATRPTNGREPQSLTARPYWGKAYARARCAWGDELPQKSTQREVFQDADHNKTVIGRQIC